MIASTEVRWRSLAEKLTKIQIFVANLCAELGYTSLV